MLALVKLHKKQGCCLYIVKTIVNIIYVRVSGDLEAIGDYFLGVFEGALLNFAHYILTQNFQRLKILTKGLFCGMIMSLNYGIFAPVCGLRRCFLKTSPQSVRKSEAFAAPNRRIKCALPPRLRTFRAPFSWVWTYRLSLCLGNFQEENL